MIILLVVCFVAFLLFVAAVRVGGRGDDDND